jgi:hypothetical protein
MQMTIKTAAARRTSDMIFGQILCNQCTKGGYLFMAVEGMYADDAIRHRNLKLSASKTATLPSVKAAKTSWLLHEYDACDIGADKVPCGIH